MITIPSLPTDNLYKFSAVSGLVLFVVGLTSPFVLDQREIEWYWQSREAINERMMDRVKFFADVQLREKLDREASLEVQGGMGGALAQMQKTELEVLKQQITERSKMRDWRTRALRVTMWVGVFVFVGGFTAWWFRYQRTQDRILLAELSKLQRDDAQNSKS